MKEVRQIIEIVFEGTNLEKLVELLFKLKVNSTLKDYNISTNTLKIDLLSKEKLFNSINQSSEGSFYFNFLNFSLKDILLLSVGFQIYKYDNIYDLNLHIEEMEISQKVSVSELLIRVESIAKELEANTYYCGYEPASDEETRFFSMDVVGPLKNWGNIDSADPAGAVYKS